ncbi:MAG: hypothetical protein O7D30_12350 [Rickettsia endosymbiont of Ixodes persulcatus]|nr:hypothetical protein [Rickettsia endosymbiont of Ixodes persulcatus]
MGLNNEEDLQIIFFSGESYADYLGFSINAENQFYSISPGTMFVPVRKCIKRNGTIAFQKACGVSVGVCFGAVEVLPRFHSYHIWR